MEYSYMFYGYYNSTLVVGQDFSYNIPLAYLLTAVFYFAVCLLCIIARSVPVSVYSDGSGMTFMSQSREFSHLDLHLFPHSLICCSHTHSMGTGARVAVATGGSAVANYSMIVFTSWNYGCLGERATRLKQKNIHYRLQVREGGDRLVSTSCQ